MTEEEIIKAINNTPEISGMTVNERLLNAGLLNEFEKSKVSDIYRAIFILQNLGVDDSSIYKILRTSNSKRFLLLVLLSVANISVTFIIVGVLSYYGSDYKTAFWLLAPLILGLTYFLYRFAILLLNGQIKYLSPILLGLAFVLMILDVLFLILNYYCWIDLFDGSTNKLI